MIADSEGRRLNRHHLRSVIPVEGGNTKNEEEEEDEFSVGHVEFENLTDNCMDLCGG